jgi:hypothetical protein
MPCQKKKIEISVISIFFNLTCVHSLLSILLPALDIFEGSFTRFTININNIMLFRHNFIVVS